MLANKSLRSKASAPRAAPAPRALSVKVNAFFSQTKLDKAATLAEVSVIMRSMPSTSISFSTRQRILECI